jgi:predicted nucleotidyltransferase
LILEKSGGAKHYGGIMSSLDTILSLAATELPEAGVECLLIGGFAVNYYGYTRNTLDVDFMILGDHLDRVRQTMIRAGFTNVSIQDNVAFFNAPGSPLRVDFLRTDALTMQALLLNAVNIHLHGYGIKVPALKDLIAMKIFALSGDPARRLGKDLPDIAYLITLHELSLESDIRPLCSRFGTEQTYDLIRTQVEALRTP